MKAFNLFQQFPDEQSCVEICRKVKMERQTCMPLLWHYG